MSTHDKWMQWLLHRRYGDNPEQHQHILAKLAHIRERVLQNAHIAPGHIVLDLGTGDGLIAFGALEQVGDQGRAIALEVMSIDHY
jgi:arsenite methyltransferase